MPIDLEALAPGLCRREDGIWFSGRQTSVSYPPHGNAGWREIEDRSFWFRHRNRCIVSLVRRFRPDGTFLDIGGGNGYVAKGLAEAGISCALLEPGFDGALAARARGIDPVICARLEDIDPGSPGIAAAGMFDVLEHIEDQTGALKKVNELLMPGGRLFLTVPAYQALYATDDATAGHFRRYTRSGLIRVLAAAGFRVEFASYIFALLPLPVLLFRTVPSRLGLRIGILPEHIAAEHAPKGLPGRLMDRLLDVEYRRINAGRTVPFGSSCLCCAVK